MQERAWGRDWHNRPVLRREWHNTDGKAHRTTGPAIECWTALPAGAHMLSFQGWYVNGTLHREGRPAVRQWHIADDGTRVLETEWWTRHNSQHRMDWYRHWIVQPDGTRTLTCEEWRANGRWHRVDGPAFGRHVFSWQGRRVASEDLPWLRRGHGFLVALAGFTAATPMQQGDGGSGGIMFPAWSRDARVRVVTWHGGGAGDTGVAAYQCGRRFRVAVCVKNEMTGYRSLDLQSSPLPQTMPDHTWTFPYGWTF